MRTPRHRSAASRAGGATPSPRSATYRGVGQQPFPTPRRAVAPNPAPIPNTRPRCPRIAGTGGQGSLRVSVGWLNCKCHPTRTYPEIRQSAAGVLGRGFLLPSRPSSLSGLLPPLARTFVAAVMAFGRFFNVNARLAQVAGFLVKHTSARPCASWLSAGGKPRRPATLRGPTTVASLALMLLFATDAHAMRCGPTSGLAQQLRARFGEEVIRTEVKEDGSAVMQLWVNRDTRTWTMVLSTVEPRMSCIIGAGRDYDGPLPEQGEKL